jgi:RING-box protein 1
MSSTPKFELRKWNGVAVWSWAICTDTCAICRNDLYEPSIEYQANPMGGGDDADCPGLNIAWGACGHVFHQDCIQRWLKTRSSCPLCNRKWDFTKIDLLTKKARDTVVPFHFETPTVYQCPISRNRVQKYQ